MYCKYDHIIINDDESGIINEKLIDNDELIKSARRWFQNFNSRIKECPFCNYHLKLIVKDVPLTNTTIDPFGTGLEYFGKLWICDNCRFWQFYSEHFVPDSILSDYYWNLTLSKLQEFQETIPEECSAELSQYLRRNLKYWNELSPTVLEKIVRDIFKANYSNCDVMHVGKPNDGGIDVLFVDTNNEKWLIQVKRRSRIKSSEGIDTVRNLLGAMLLNNILKGVIVSTADHFSYRAHEAVESVANKGYFIELIDKGKLNRMLDSTLPNNPWLDFMNDQHLPNKNMWLDV